MHWDESPEDPPPGMSSLLMSHGEVKRRPFLHSLRSRLQHSRPLIARLALLATYPFDPYPVVPSLFLVWLDLVVRLVGGFQLHAVGRNDFPDVTGVVDFSFARV